MKQNDLSFMQRALSLAARGKGLVHPNPCVGCVIVKSGKVVGEGFHARFGGPHAEVVALKKAGARARGADMYVTLEPCSHWGKTPPCAPAVAAAGLRRVHVAMLDPNPIVSGRGVAALKKAGIRVSVGLERSPAALLNRAFITWMTKNRPHVILKMASSLDGKIASRAGNSRWISSPASRRLVHRLRAESDAVLVGAQTAVTDNPQLTSHGAGRNPLRIVLDPRLRTPSRLRLYRDGVAKTLVVASTRAADAPEKALRKKGVDVLRVALKDRHLNLPEILKLLAKRGISQLLVEGGSETAWHFLRERVVDEVVFFLAPLLVGGRTSPTSVGGDGFATVTTSRKLTFLSTLRVDQDLLVHGLVN